MSITITQTVFVPVPPGTYVAKILSIEEETGQFGAQLKFKFELQLKEGEQPKVLNGWCSKKFGPKCKLFEWTIATLGPIDRTYTFNSDDLIGKKVLVVVTQERGETGIYNKITQVLPYRKPQPVPQSPTPDEDW